MSSVKIQGSATGTAAFTIAVPAGTSTDRTINLPDAAGSFVLADASGDVAVTGDLTVDTDTLYVDSANNRVGVGTASPTQIIEASSSSNPALHITNTDGTNGATLRFAMATNGAFIGLKSPTGGSDALRFGTGNEVERMRLVSGGQLCLNQTDAVIASRTCKIAINQDNASGFGLGINNIRNDTSGSGGIVTKNNETSGTFDVMSILNSGGTEIGIINANNSAVGFTSTSDYRLKENVVDLTGAIDRVKTLQPKRFNFISDPDVTVDGFIAHEVSDAVPEAVVGTKDAMRDEQYEVTPAVLDDDGNVVTEAVMGTRQVPKYQGIDPAKLVPLLTAAIKEQQALIEDLQNRIAALEAV